MTECVQGPADKATKRLLIKYAPGEVARLPAEVRSQFEEFDDKFGVFGDFCDMHADEFSTRLKQNPKHTVKIVPLEE